MTWPAVVSVRRAMHSIGWVTRIKDWQDQTITVCDTSKEGDWVNLHGLDNKL